MFFRTILLLVLALLPGVVGASAAALPDPVAAAPLTAEELFRGAALGQAELSPDGKRLGAIITDEHDSHNLLIFDLQDRKPTGLRGSRSFEVSSFRWLGDDRVLFNVVKDKLYAWGLFSAKLDRMDRHHAINNFDATAIVGVPRHRPGRVLLWIVQSSEKFGAPGPLLELDAYRPPDAFTGLSDRAIVRSYQPPHGGSVVGWVPNHDGELALCITWGKHGTRLHRYLRGSDSWRALELNPDVVKPVSMDPDSRFLWVVTHSAAEGYALRRYDLDTGELAPPVLTDSDYDMSSGHLYFSEQTGELVGVSYTQRARRTVWFSQDLVAIQGTIDQHYPDSTNVLVDSDRAERKFLFLRTGPKHPGTYALLDLETKTLQQVARAAPWLEGRPLSEVHPVHFRTRDGVKLEGYLTLPATASEQSPAPLVVLAHGGPWVRVTADFDPEAQFLASRGYAVLQPNYRGSTGYSPAISDRYRFDFRRMHDDVTDATRAMMRNRFIDPKRVAIMGASFGGYLSLTGVAFEDGLYTCAVSTCGVYDWERMIKSRRFDGRPGEYQFLLDTLGRPGRDRERLEEISPLAHVDRIRVPVLIAHGTDDHIVDIGQSKKLVSALKKRGVPHETFFRSLEGHGFYNYKNRVEYYHRVEAFLAAHLGGASLAPVKAGRR